MNPYTEEHFPDQSQPSNSGVPRFRSAPSSLLSSFKAHDFIQSAPLDSSSKGFPQNELPALEARFRVDAPNSTATDQSTHPKLAVDRSNLLLRQSSSPAGFFSNLNAQDGFAMMGGAGNGFEGFRFSSSSAANGEGQLNTHLSRLKNQVDIGPGRSNSIGHLPRIPEIGAEATNDSGSDDDAQFQNNGFSFTCWNDNNNSSALRKNQQDNRNLYSGLDTSPPQTHVLSHHLSLPKTSAEMAAVEKLLNFQDSVPCKIRAKRGCATHPRSIAERVRRTRISDKMKKLQDLVPNMEKQVNTSEMLDSAVEYIKELQQQYKSEMQVSCRGAISSQPNFLMNPRRESFDNRAKRPNTAIKEHLKFIKMAMEALETVLLHGTLRATIYGVDKIHSMALLNSKHGNLVQKVGRTILFQMKRLCVCDTEFTGNKLYATVDVDQVRLGRTRTVKNAVHPNWSENFTLYTAHRAGYVVFTVKDDNPVGATLIGRARVPVRDILQGQLVTRLIDIVDEKWHPIGSKIHVSLQFFSVTQDDNWSQGIKTPRLDLVPRTFFKQRQGCRITLYHDVHVEDNFPSNFERWTGLPYRPHRCWIDIYDAINNAEHLIYIAGWSVSHDLQLVRDPENPNQNTPTTLGNILRAKAANDVRVLILVWDDRTSNELLKKDGIMATHDEETYEFFKNTKVNCVKCPRSSERAQSILQEYAIDAMFTHHQKTIVVDVKVPESRKRTVVSFVGGIDLCEGRYDTQEHPLFRTLNTTHKKDFHQPNFQGASIEKGGPREPWHDIHCRIEGPAAWDVLYNFEQRWAQQVKRVPGLSGRKPGILTMQELDAIDPSPTDLAAQPDDPQSWNVQIFRSIDSGAAFGYAKVDPERAAAVGLLNEKYNLVERSIQDAYICAIRRAKNFIYIENQYFLGSSFAWNPRDDMNLDDVGALHLIPKELSLKIVSNIKEGKRFSVYVVVPMWPEGPPESESVEAILDWQRRTMEMMYTDVAKAIQEKKLNAHPSDYLSFFCLGNKERRDPAGDQSNPTDKPPQDSDYARAQLSRRFMIYRDTEIAMGAYQPKHLMTSSESPSAGEVFRFRMSLWYEHLRQFHPLFKRPETLGCMQEVNKLAMQNWKLYVDDNYTDDLPGHLMTYPIQFEMGENQEWGAIRPILPCFPDTKATILGEKAKFLPPILTT
ncbi:hypothetical protein V2J09_009316 [Rumex salicifolius]